MKEIGEYGPCLREDSMDEEIGECMDLARCPCIYICTCTLYLQCGSYANLITESG